MLPDNWLAAILGRKPRMVAAVPVASKVARIIWAMMSRDAKPGHPHTHRCDPSQRLGNSALRGRSQGAYRHLVEWPFSIRDTAHSIAFKACQAALCGEIEAETARGLFAAFAEKHDMSAPETLTIATFRERGDSGPHVQRDSPMGGISIR